MDINEKDIQTLVESVLTRMQGAGSGTPLRPAAAACGASDPFPVEVSARHVHLTKEAAAALRGPGSELHKKKRLSQPGEFLAEERVKLVTPKGQIANVAILGPERKAVQVELSATDAAALGIQAPVNLSGDLSGAADVLIVGPAGIWEAKSSAIIARAHLHLTPKDAEHYGVRDGQVVSVRVDSERPITFEGIVCRVRSDMALAMHIDFDEANAGLIKAGATGVIASAGCCSGSQGQAGSGKAAFAPAAAQPFLVTKKLITEADALELKKGLGAGGELAVPKGTILTPSAKDVLNGAGISVKKV
jgi:propanediol utilization protein